MRAWFLPFLLVGASCGDDGGSTPIDAIPIDMARIDAAVDAAPPDAPDPRNATYTLGGGANAALWDATASRLYLTDNNSNSLLAWDDTNHCCAIHRALPLSTAGISLGDIATKPGGGFYVANFGFGMDGKLVEIPATGNAINITGLDAARRRIGLSRAPNGKLYTSYFTGSGMNPTGGIAEITITGTTATETVVATESSTGVTLKKMVGIVATNDALFVSEQSNTANMSVIYKITLPANTVSIVAANLPHVDLLSMLPNGDLLTGGNMGIRRVSQAGVVTPVTTLGTYDNVRGLAYDAAMQRMFIIDHSNTVGTPDKLHIRPFTP